MRTTDDDNAAAAERARPSGAAAATWPAVVATQAFGLGSLAALVALSHLSRVPFAHVARDPATSLGGPFVTGYLSYLGACLWCAAAAVALFSAALARGSRGARPAGAFFLATGLLAALLLADDLFMVHDGLVPHLLGDVERWNLALYAVLAAAYLAAFAPLIRRTCLPLLAAAGCAFATSVMVDVQLIPVPESRRHLVEDGCKFLGIANWAAWVTLACLRHLQIPAGEASPAIAAPAATA
jgi:hypothetical protein